MSFLLALTCPCASTVAGSALAGRHSGWGAVWGVRLLPGLLDLTGIPTRGLCGFALGLCFFFFCMKKTGRDEEGDS